MAEANLPATTEPKAPAKPPAIPIPAGPRGLVLTDLDQMWRFAGYVAASGMAPKGLTDPRGIVVALQLGAELGLSPMASMQNIAVINGRPTIWGDAMLAVCRASGFFDESVFEEKLTGSGESYHASCTVRRLPNGKPLTRSFSWADAKRAQLTGKQGPWQQYPQRMLQLRARSWALRDGFADVLRGLSATEEMADVVEGTVVTTRKPAGSLQDLTQRLGGDGEDAPADATADEPPRTISMGLSTDDPLASAAMDAVLDGQDPYQAAGDAAAEAIGDQTPAGANPIESAIEAFNACGSIQEVDKACKDRCEVCPDLATGIQGQAEKRKAELAETLPADTPNENDTFDVLAVAQDELRSATALNKCGEIYRERSQQCATQEEKDKLHAMSQARQDEIRGSRGAKSND